MPIGLSLLARLGTEARLYRAMFLEEIGKDYVPRARQACRSLLSCSATC